MAPLTWRNVDGPDFGKSALILESAARNWAGGFSGISGALDKARDIQKTNRSAALIDDLARVDSEAGVNPLLDSLPGMIRDRDMTKELQAAILGLRKDAMGYDTERLNQAGIRARTAATNAAAGRAAAAARREDAERAALQGAAPDIIAAFAARNDGKRNYDQDLALPDFNPDTGTVTPGAINVTIAEGGGSVNESFGDIFARNPDLPLNKVLDFMNESEDRWNVSARNQDDNRDRDREAEARIRNEEVARASEELAFAAMNDADVFSADDMMKYINKSGASDEVKAAAFRRATELPADAIMSPDALAGGMPGRSQTELALESAAAATRAELAGNDAVRINERAQSVYNNDNPALTLKDTVGFEDLTEGQILERIKDTQRQLRQEGIDASPAMAAALLEEVAFRSRLRPFDGVGFGEINTRAKDAVELGKTVLGERGRREATEIGITGRQRLEAIEGAKAQLDQLERMILIQESKTGVEATDLRQRYAALAAQAANFERKEE